jgi:hypothetical protein
MYRQYKQPPHLLRPLRPHPQYIQHLPLQQPPQRIDLKDLPADKYCKDKGYEKQQGITNARISQPPPKIENVDAFCKRHHFVLKPKVSPKVSPKTKRVSAKASKAAKAAKAAKASLHNVPKVLHIKPVSNKHITV